MEGYYEFNVSKNGKHLFATAERSFPITSSLQRRLEFYSILREKFPESEGYAITVTIWNCFAEEVVVMG